MTYFRMGNPYYHRRDAVSRPCSGWEGVVPTRYGRQTVTGVRDQESGIREPEPGLTHLEEVLDCDCGAMGSVF